MRRPYVFWTILSFTLVFALIPPALNAKAVYLIVPSFGTESLATALIRSKDDIWDDYPLLKRICAAESNYGPNNEPRQFLPDGSVLWGWEDGKIVHRDVGSCQINTWVHADELKRLGLDVIDSEADNVAYAKILFDREGWRPWKNSKHHWDPENLVK